MPYLPAKVELVSWTTFLPKGFENGIIQEFSTSDYMLEGSISCFACFLVKENSLETDCDFRKCLTKGFFLLNMKNFEISVLTANSLFLQTATLNFQGIRLLDGPCWVLLILYCIFPGSCWCLFIKALPNMIEAVVVFILQLIKFFLQAANLLPWEPSVSMSACSLGLLSTLLALHPASVLGYLPNYWLIKDYHCSWT